LERKFQDAIVEWNYAKTGFGKRWIYRIRDWGISRQRFWARQFHYLLEGVDVPAGKRFAGPYPIMRSLRPR